MSLTSGYILTNILSSAALSDGRVHLHPSFLLHDHPAGESVHFDHIVNAQLSAASGLLDTVDLNLAVLNTDLGFNAVLNQIGEFEKLAEADRCSHNRYVGNFALHSTSDWESLITSVHGFSDIR